MTGLTSGEALQAEKFDLNPSGLSDGTGVIEKIVP
jgi:hypothetical protein